MRQISIKLKNTDPLIAKRGHNVSAMTSVERTTRRDLTIILYAMNFFWYRKDANMVSLCWCKFVNFICSLYESFSNQWRGQSLLCIRKRRKECRSCDNRVVRFVFTNSEISVTMSPIYINELLLHISVIMKCTGTVFTIYQVILASIKFSCPFLWKHFLKIKRKCHRKKPSANN